MRWGTTAEEHARRKKVKREHVKKWRLWFAWHPVMLVDGSWAWLERVARRDRDYALGGRDHVFWQYSAVTWRAGVMWRAGEWCRVWEPHPMAGPWKPDDCGD